MPPNPVRSQTRQSLPTWMQEGRLWGDAIRRLS